MYVRNSNETFDSCNGSALNNKTTSTTSMHCNGYACQNMTCVVISDIICSHYPSHHVQNKNCEKLATLHSMTLTTKPQLPHHIFSCPTSLWYAVNHGKERPQSPSISWLYSCGCIHSYLEFHLPFDIVFILFCNEIAPTS